MFGAGDTSGNKKTKSLHLWISKSGICVEIGTIMVFRLMNHATQIHIQIK